MKNYLNKSNDSQSRMIITQDEFINNDQSSYAQSNQQMQSAEQFQKMFQVFQKMATDPGLFMKMMSSVKAPEPDPDYRKRQFQIEQHKYRNHQVSPKRRQQDYPVPSKESRKKGTDVLGGSYMPQQDNVLDRYCPTPKEQLQNLADSTITVTNRGHQANKIDERPIQSNYAKMQQVPQNNRNNLSHVKQEEDIQKYIIDDERPIKPAKGYEIQLNQSGIMNNSNMIQVDPSKYKQAEERPIKGIQGDFKNYIMNQQGFPMSEQPQEMEEGHLEEEHQGKPREFLKRGSRQYLSSAKDRSVPKPKLSNKNSDKQALNTSTNMGKQGIDKQQRSISQNRVLGRKSISSKSITKKIPKIPQPNEEKKTLQYSNTTANYNSSAAYDRDDREEGNRTPRMTAKNQMKKGGNKREKSNSPSFQLDRSPKVKKQQPKKNIFQDSSSSQSERESKSTKNNKNQQTKGFESMSNKIQVIQGVFLTKKQLHNILTKHGKSMSQKPNADQSKIQQLKSKYIDLCNILTEERQIFQQQMIKQKQQFEAYKQSELAKIKNEKKVQQRNLVNNQKNKQKQKQKEQFEALRKVLQKQREQFKHKQKNYKLMIEKYKKLAEEKQKQSTNNEPKYNTIQPSKNEEASSTANKKKGRSSGYPSQAGNTQNEEVVSNSFKNSEQNAGQFLNRKENSMINASDSYSIKNSSAMPNYQDLRKPATNPKSNALQGHLNKNIKYEYYEDYDSKQTVKGNNKYSRDEEYGDEAQINEQQQQESDTQEIVEYNPSMKLSDLTKIPLSIKMVTDEMIENLFRYQNNPEYRHYLELTKSKSRNKIHTARNAAEKKTTNIYADGGKEVIFDTGVRKQYFNNGYVIIFFTNGDIKQKLSDETVLYFFKQKQVDQITLPNKTNIYRFDNNQVQFHFQDKTVQIRHPDGTFKVA